jgi:hypothetical protein
MNPMASSSKNLCACAVVEVSATTKRNRAVRERMEALFVVL